MGFQLFQSEKTEKYHFRLCARNGQIVLASQAYSSKTGAQNGIQSTIKNTADGDGQFERNMSKNGKPYFCLKAKNGEIIGRSETYSSNSAMEKGIRSVCKNAQESKIKDLT